jgi:hypothetical protein
MSYLGTREQAKADTKAVCVYDNAMDQTSPILNGESDGGGIGEPKSAEFKPKTYTIHASQTGVRRTFK